MNKQRKVLITITYNKMGIIIDTKAEEVAQTNMQPTCNQLATDCISRAAAIDELRKCNRHCIDLFDSYHIDIEDAEARIRRLPSAQPERKKGKWIKRGGTINCSSCKHSNWSECFEYTVMNFNFCPNCGAKMEGAEE